MKKPFPLGQQNPTSLYEKWGLGIHSMTPSIKDSRVTKWEYLYYAISPAGMQQWICVVLYTQGTAEINYKGAR